MKKKIISIGVILLILILIIPLRKIDKNNGTTTYKALLYQVTKQKELIPCNCEIKKYKTGLSIQIMGHTIYEKINNPLLENEKEEKQQQERMLMLNGILYYDTGKIETMGRCGVGMKKVSSSLAETEIPKEEGQVNFKNDSPAEEIPDQVGAYGLNFKTDIIYQEITKERVDVWIKEAWYIFESKESE